MMWRKFLAVFLSFTLLLMQSSPLIAGNPSVLNEDPRAPQNHGLSSDDTIDQAVKLYELLKQEQGQGSGEIQINDQEVNSLSREEREEYNDLYSVTDAVLYYLEHDNSFAGKLSQRIKQVEGIQKDIDPVTGFLPAFAMFGLMNPNSRGSYQTLFRNKLNTGGCKDGKEDECTLDEASIYTSLFMDASYLKTAFRGYNNTKFGSRIVLEVGHLLLQLGNERLGTSNNETGYAIFQEIVGDAIVAAKNASYRQEFGFWETLEAIMAPAATRMAFINQRFINPGAFLKGIDKGQYNVEQQKKTNNLSAWVDIGQLLGFYAQSDQKAKNVADALVDKAIENGTNFPFVLGLLAQGYHYQKNKKDATLSLLQTIYKLPKRDMTAADNMYMREGMYLVCNSIQGCSVQELKIDSIFSNTPEERKRALDFFHDLQGYELMGMLVETYGEIMDLIMWTVLGGEVALLVGLLFMVGTQVLTQTGVLDPESKWFVWSMRILTLVAVVGIGGKAITNGKVYSTLKAKKAVDLEAIAKGNTRVSQLPGWKGKVANATYQNAARGMRAYRYMKLQRIRAKRKGANPEQKPHQQAHESPANPRQDNNPSNGSDSPRRNPSNDNSRADKPDAGEQPKNGELPPEEQPKNGEGKPGQRSSEIGDNLEEKIGNEARQQKPTAPEGVSDRQSNRESKQSANEESMKAKAARMEVPLNLWKGLSSTSQELWERVWSQMKAFLEEFPTRSGVEPAESTQEALQNLWKYINGGVQEMKDALLKKFFKYETFMNEASRFTKEQFMKCLDEMTKPFTRSCLKALDTDYVYMFRVKMGQYIASTEVSMLKVFENSGRRLNTFLNDLKLKTQGNHVEAYIRRARDMGDNEKIILTDGSKTPTGELIVYSMEDLKKNPALWEKFNPDAEVLVRNSAGEFKPIKNNGNGATGQTINFRQLVDYNNNSINGFNLQGYANPEEALSALRTDAGKLGEALLPKVEELLRNNGVALRKVVLKLKRLTSDETSLGMLDGRTTAADPLAAGSTIKTNMHMHFEFEIEGVNGETFMLNVNFPVEAKPSFVDFVKNSNGNLLE